MGEKGGGNAGGDQQQNRNRADDDPAEIAKAWPNAKGRATCGQAYGGGAGAAHQRQGGKPKQQQIFNHHGAHLPGFWAIAGNVAWFAGCRLERL